MQRYALTAMLMLGKAQNGRGADSLHADWLKPPHTTLNQVKFSALFWTSEM